MRDLVLVSEGADSSFRLTLEDKTIKWLGQSYGKRSVYAVMLFNAIPAILHYIGGDELPEVPLRIVADPWDIQLDAAMVGFCQKFTADLVDPSTNHTELSVELSAEAVAQLHDWLIEAQQEAGVVAAPVPGERPSFGL